jgi:hypothetical protein
LFTDFALYETRSSSIPLLEIIDYVRGLLGDPAAVEFLRASCVSAPKTPLGCDWAGHAKD